MSTLKTNTIQHLTSGFNNVVQFVDGAGTQNGTLCRTWVNFTGTGTVAIRASFNVSSITDINTGQYTVNFTTAMVDSNYSVGISGQDTGVGSQATDAMAIASGGMAPGSVSVSNISYTGYFTDLPTVCVQIFR